MRARNVSVGAGYFADFIAHGVMLTLHAFLANPFFAAANFLFIYGVMVVISIRLNHDGLWKVDRMDIIPAFIFSIAIGSVSIGYIVGLFR